MECYTEQGLKRIIKGTKRRKNQKREKLNGYEAYTRSLTNLLSLFLYIYLSILKITYNIKQETCGKFFLKKDRQSFRATIEQETIQYRKWYEVCSYLT